MEEKRQKNRITFFDATLREGGAERVISILSNELVISGYEVNILLYYDDDIFYNISPNIKITIVEKETKTKNILKNIQYISQYFKENSDLIISFLAPFNMLSLFANRHNNIPIIVADRNDPRHIPSNKYIRLARDFLYDKLSSLVVVQTENNKKYFNNNTRQKTVVIFNPIDLKGKEGQAIAFPKEKNIISVGRLIPQKNQKVLIDAFNEIYKEHNDYKLIIYGEGNSRNELEEQIKTLNLTDCVLLPGNEKNIFNKISSARMFVLCSNFEGMPNSLIEAMCLGLPVISTKVSGANELIVHNENGLLIDINNPKQLKDSMSLLIKNDKLCNKLGTNASKIYNELNSNSIIKKWIEMINTFFKE